MASDHRPVRAPARILSGVVEEYVSSGAPVASRLLVERERFDVSTSTVRAELAELERLGFLTTRTPRRRVPTEAATASTPTPS